MQELLPPSVNAPTYPGGEINREPAEGVERMSSECFYRTVLLFSLRRDKVEKTPPQELKSAAVKMARGLRGFAGVKHVEAVGFDRWEADPHDPRPVPWKPWGVLLFVEAADPGLLGEFVGKIWEAAATQFDPDRMKLNPMDSF